jgi:TRAP-type C4-dicarboxylate transport system permease small subunit
MSDPKGGPEPSPPGLANLLFVRIPYVITGCLILVAIAINFANIIARYLFSSAIFWTEEVLVYLISWSVFVAAITIAYRGEHITMDLFSSRMKGALRTIVNGLIVVLFLASCIFVVFQSFDVVTLHSTNGTRSIAAGIPMAIPHSALLVGFALMALAIVFRLGAYLRGRFD